MSEMVEARARELALEDVKKWSPLSHADSRRAWVDRHWRSFVPQAIRERREAEKAEFTPGNWLNGDEQMGRP